ncbi:hypothetical protein RYX36_005100 [Vicia faba]
MNKFVNISDARKLKNITLDERVSGSAKVEEDQVDTKVDKNQYLPPFPFPTPSLPLPTLSIPPLPPVDIPGVPVSPIPGVPLPPIPRLPLPPLPIPSPPPMG